MDVWDLLSQECRDEVSHCLIRMLRFYMCDCVVLNSIFMVQDSQRFLLKIKLQQQHQLLDKTYSAVCLYICCFLLKVVLIDSDSLLDTLETYLRKHRFVIFFQYLKFVCLSFSN